MEGWLLKRSDHKLSSLKWGDRYFALNRNLLNYYIKSTDLEPKGIYTLTSSCIVSHIQVDKNNTPYYIFSISWPLPSSSTAEESANNRVVNLRSPDVTAAASAVPRSISKLKLGALALGGAVLGASTGGFGLLAGMALLGGHYATTTTTTTTGGVGGSGGVNGLDESKERLRKNKVIINSDNVKQVVLACNNYADAEKWVEAIEYQIEVQRLSGDETTTDTSPAALFSQNLSRRSPELRLEETEEWTRSATFKLHNVMNGIRILEYEPPIGSSQVYSSGDPPCFRVNISVNGSANDAFSIVKDMSLGYKTGVIKQTRTLESIDEYSDIIHLMFEPIYLKPTWTVARDVCLRRTWRRINGSFVMCLDSTTHPDCPVTNTCVRAEMFGVYVISPAASTSNGRLMPSTHPECQISFIAQFDPKGWIWGKYGYQHSFLQEIMLHVLDIRDQIELERFVKIKIDNSNYNNNSNNSSKANSRSSSFDYPSDGPYKPIKNIENILDTNGPSPMLPREMWANIDASLFRIRGKTYNQDKVKAVSAKPLFKLVAVDLIESIEPIYNVAAHPRNRVFLANERGEQFWCFVVNIMIPGGVTNMNIVAYYIGDKALFDENTPFAKIGKQFFFGNDNDFRNSRFKLIPKVVDGNYLVRQAVKDTPTLLGTKLNQIYTRESHYFELAVDVASSTVAKYTVGIASSYAKSLVVDMAYCLEGRDVDELPEVLMGGFRCVNIDLKLAKRM